MSKQSNTLTRRNFLKGATYTSALSIGGVSSIAFATCGKSSGTVSGSSSITLINQSDRTVALDASNPVSLEKVNGWVVVKINKASAQSIMDLRVDKIITLSKGQKLAFPVESDLASMLQVHNDDIVITNQYSALNNVVPISTYESAIA